MSTRSHHPQPFGFRKTETAHVVIDLIRLSVLLGHDRGPHLDHLLSEERLDDLPPELSSEVPQQDHHDGYKYPLIHVIIEEEGVVVIYLI
jgi:hypothetical protein